MKERDLQKLNADLWDGAHSQALGKKFQQLFPRFSLAFHDGYGFLFCFFSFGRNDGYSCWVVFRGYHCSETSNQFIIYML